MKDAERFAQSIPRESLEAYRYISDGAQKFQHTLAHYMFRWLLLLKYGKNSTAYLKSLYDTWTGENGNGAWDSLSLPDKRNNIKVSTAYFLFFKKRYWAFNLVARLFPNSVNNLPTKIDRLVWKFRNQRRTDSPAGIKRMRVAFVVFGDASKRAACEELTKWLNLVIDNLDFVIYLPEALDVTDRSLPNAVYRVIPRDWGSLNFAETDEPVFFSGVEPRTLVKSSPLPGLLSRLACDAVLVSPDCTRLDPLVWQARLARFWFESQANEPPAVTSEVEA